jgi:hypothetical protein
LRETPQRVGQEFLRSELAGQCHGRLGTGPRFGSVSPPQVKVHQAGAGPRFVPGEAAFTGQAQRFLQVVACRFQLTEQQVIRAQITQVVALGAYVAKAAGQFQGAQVVRPRLFHIAHVST